VQQAETIRGFGVVERFVSVLLLALSQLLIVGFCCFHVFIR